MTNSRLAQLITASGALTGIDARIAAQLLLDRLRVAALVGVTAVAVRTAKPTVQ
jgi:hypothetical protein